MYMYDLYRHVPYMYIVDTYMYMYDLSTCTCTMSMYIDHSLRCTCTLVVSLQPYRNVMYSLSPGSSLCACAYHTVIRRPAGCPALPRASPFSRSYSCVLVCSETRNVTQRASARGALRVALRSVTYRIVCTAVVTCRNSYC